MSVRASAQKQDEKRTTLDEIKKIGYSMKVQKTAMDAVESPGDVLEAHFKEIKEAEKRLENANERVIKLRKQVTALEDEIWSLNVTDSKFEQMNEDYHVLRFELEEALREEEKAQLNLKSVLERKIKRIRVRQPGSNFVPEGKEEVVAILGDAIARAKEHVENAKKNLAEAKEEEENTRNEIRDLTAKVASFDGEDLIDAESSELIAIMNELEPLRGYLPSAVKEREEAEEELEGAQEELELAQETANEVVKNDPAWMVTISRFLGNIRPFRLFKANRASKLHIFP